MSLFSLWRYLVLTPTHFDNKRNKPLIFLRLKLDLSIVSKSKAEQRNHSLTSIQNHHHTDFPLACFTYQSVNKIVTNYIDQCS